MADQAALDRWERQAEWPMGVVALVFLTVYSIRILGHPHGMLTHVIDVLTFGSWAVFVIDYAVRIYLAPNRGGWFVRHLLDLAIVALPMLQPLRVVRLMVLISALQKAIGTAIHGRALAYTVSTAIVVVYVGSLAELQAERHDTAATINSFGKALWWSITTITTVGYGHEYPITTAGRIIAALLMICGMSLLGMITASLASWMVHHIGAERPTHRTRPAPDADLDELRREIRALRELLGPQPDRPNA